MRSATREPSGLPAVVRWASLLLAGLAVTLVVGGSVALVISIRASVAWAVESPVALFGGTLLMGVATLVGVLLTRSVRRDRADLAVAIAGASLALLLAVAGTLVTVRAVALFPGPLPVSLP